jgi:hypothetical protein
LNRSGIRQCGRLIDMKERLVGTLQEVDAPACDWWRRRLSEPSADALK